MTIEKTTQAAYLISQIQGGQLVKRQFFFPKKEAIKLFREHLMVNFLEKTKGWQSIAHTERKCAERLEAKGKIEIAKHKGATWQMRLK